MVFLFKDQLPDITFSIMQYSANDVNVTFAISRLCHNQTISQSDESLTVYNECFINAQPRFPQHNNVKFRE